MYRAWTCDAPGTRTRRGTARWRAAGSPRDAARQPI